MPLQTSGTISMADIRREFFGSVGTLGLGSTCTADATDPYIGRIPVSAGTNVQLTNFYGSSRRTARLGRPGFGNASASSGYLNRRIGWSLTNGSQFWLYEYGSQNVAFGSITRYTGLSTTANLGGIWVTQYNYGGSQTYPIFNISHRSSSNSGWTRFYIKGPTFPSGVTREYTFYRTSAAMFNRPNYGTTEQRNYYAWRWVWYTGDTTTLRNIANLIVYCRIYNRSLFVKFT